MLLVLTLAIPFLNGCSTLGIATADELTAVETRLRNADRAATTRIEVLETDTAEMKTTIAAITTELDSLNVRFARARTWLETMNLDTITADAQAAVASAKSLETSSKSFMDNYLDLIRAMNALFDQQLKLLEPKTPPAGEAESSDSDASGDPPAEEPAETGSDDG